MNTQEIIDYLDNILADDNNENRGHSISEYKAAMKLFSNEFVEENIAPAVEQGHHSIYDYITLPETQDLLLRQAHTLLLAGQWLVITAQFKASDALIEAARDLSKQDAMQPLDVYALTLRGIRYHKSNEFQRAYDSYNEALTLAEDAPETERNYERIATLGINVYAIRLNVDNGAKPLLRWCQTAVDAATRCEDDQLVATALRNLGHCLAHHRESFTQEISSPEVVRGHLQESLKLAREAYEKFKDKTILQQVIESQWALASFESDLGSPTALACLPSIDEVTAVENPHIEAHFYIIQADIFRKNSRFKEAEEALSNAFGIASEFEMRDTLMEILRALGDIGESRLIYESHNYSQDTWNPIIDTVTTMVEADEARSEDEGALDKYFLDYSEAIRIFLVRSRLELARHDRESSSRWLQKAHIFSAQLLDKPNFNA